MGGGGSYFHSDAKELKDKINKIESSSEYQDYEVKVSKILLDTLAKYNDRDINSINTHLKEIIQAIQNNIEDSIDLLLGGSVAKHTYVDGISDIDSLVILNNTDLKEQFPNDINKYLANLIMERFPKTKVSIGNMAITVQFSDCEIQLLPALRVDSESLRIPNDNGSGWTIIKPNVFVTALTDINKSNGGKIVPVIKLAKGIISNLSEKQKITGYHVEAMAIECFKDYTGEYKPNIMLKEYFKFASERVQLPIIDKTGQSTHVDDYLGESNSLERQIVSNAFDRIYRQIKAADVSMDSDKWINLIEG